MSVVWFIVTGVVVALGIALAFVDSEFLQMLRELVQLTLRYNDEVVKVTLQGAGMLAEVALLGIVSVAVSMLHFYAAMSLGYGFTGHKALWAVIWYFIISFVLQLAVMLLMMIGVDSGIVNSLNLGSMASWHLTMLGSVAGNLVVGAALYVVTWLNLKKRLNLA